MNPLYKHRHTLQCNTYIHNNYTSLDILYKENGSNVDPICFSKNKQTKKRKRKNFPHFWTFEVVENFGWETRLNINNFLVSKKYTIFKVDNAENVLHAKRSLKRLEPYENRTSFLMNLKLLLYLKRTSWNHKNDQNTMKASKLRNTSKFCK